MTIQQLTENAMYILPVLLASGVAMAFLGYLVGAYLRS